MRRNIFVDFDGVLTTYENGWQGYHVINDPPNPGACNWMWKVLELKHFNIIIVSGRAKTWRGRRAIRRWLKKHGFPAVKVTCKKVNDFIMLVDDRAWHFRGDNFPDLHTLRTFQPWCKEKQ